MLMRAVSLRPYRPSSHARLLIVPFNAPLRSYVDHRSSSTKTDTWSAAPPLAGGGGAL